VLERLPSTLNRDIDTLLPMTWAPAAGSATSEKSKPVKS
jgi:hypothetical protein